MALASSTIAARKLKSSKFLKCIFQLISNYKVVYRLDNNNKSQIAT